MNRIHIRRAGGLVVALVEGAGLLVILVATIVAGWQEVMVMLERGRVTLTDLLLMFIYVEVVTMVGVFWSSGKLPVRMPLYIAMVAIARYMILDNQHLTDWGLLAMAGAILLLAFAVLVVRYGHIKLPYSDTDAGTEKDGWQGGSQ